MTDALGDELFSFEVEGPLGANGCLGVAYGWEHFWVSARGVNAVAPHLIGKFDMTGNLVGVFQQNAAVNSTSAWGGRDGCVDEDLNRLYFGSESGTFVTYAFDPGTGDIDAGAVVSNSQFVVVRALAKLPNGNFITANFTPVVTEFTSGGTPVSAKLVSATAVYGLAYDPGADAVWSYSQDAGPLNVPVPGGGTQLVRFVEHANDGVYTPTGRQFDAPSTAMMINNRAGGAEVLCYNGVRAIAAVRQTVPDTVSIYDLGTGFCEPCYADCDLDGALTFFDYLCFQNAFASSDPYADCDGNGSFDVIDLLCFDNSFGSGCP